MSKPIGARISAAGSSLMAVRKTSAAPASTPLAASGAVIVRRTSSGPRPVLRAASSIMGEICSSEARVAQIASGRNSTTQAKTSIASVW